MWEVISENDRGRGGSRQDTENKTFEIAKKNKKREGGGGAEGRTQIETFEIWKTTERKVRKMRQRINDNMRKILLKAEWKQERNKRQPLANTSSAHCL